MPLSRLHASRLARVKAGIVACVVVGGLMLTSPASAWMSTAPASTPRAAVDPQTDEAGFLASINQVRADHGRAPLRANAALRAIAAPWSAQMASSATLSHNPQLVNQLPSDWSTAGENVGVGPGEPDIAQAFINSPEHYTNIVRPTYTDVGIGVVYSQDGRLWVTEDFASFAPTPTTTPAPAPAPASIRPRPQTTDPRPPVPTPPSTTSQTKPPRATGPPSTSPPPTTTTTTPADINALVAELEGLDANS